MLTPSEAAQTILQHVTPLPTERRALKQALDLVLAEDVRSPIDLPGWDNSAMDGYAVRAADVAGAGSDRPATLTVIETVPAGRFPAQPVGPGQATRIFTGAPLPAGPPKPPDPRRPGGAGTLGRGTAPRPGPQTPRARPAPAGRH